MNQNNKCPNCPTGRMVSRKAVWAMRAFLFGVAGPLLLLAVGLAIPVIGWIFILPVAAWSVGPCLTIGAVLLICAFFVKGKQCSKSCHEKIA